MRTASEVACQVIGFSKAQALADIDAAGYFARISSVDGVTEAGITDMSFNRINLSIEDDVVIAASVG